MQTKKKEYALACDTTQKCFSNTYTHTHTHTQICDELGGTCDTEVLLQLGPEVYSKAMEITAARSALTQVTCVRHVYEALGY